MSLSVAINGRIFFLMMRRKKYIERRSRYRGDWGLWTELGHRLGDLEPRLKRDLSVLSSSSVPSEEKECLFSVEEGLIFLLISLRYQAPIPQITISLPESYSIVKEQSSWENGSIR
jgi:hypothetical protein